MKQVEDIPHRVEKLNSTTRKTVSKEMHKDILEIEKKNQTKCTFSDSHQLK